MSVGKNCRMNYGFPGIVRFARGKSVSQGVNEGIQKWSSTFAKRAKAELKVIKRYKEKCKNDCGLDKRGGGQHLS